MSSPIFLPSDNKLSSSKTPNFLSSQVEHLKSYEAEVTQLRGVTNEQQKSIRSAARQLEQFKTNERFMQSEIISLKLLLEKEKSHCQVITSSTQRRLDAQEQTGLDQLLKQKAELNAKV